MYKKFLGVILSCSLVIPMASYGEEFVDLDMVTKIRHEGFNRSEVMDTIAYLTDVIGPRLTNSPQMKEANEWTRGKLEEWGLEKVEIEAWGEFGRGWSFERCVVHMTAPHKVPLIALPKAWTPGTDGVVRGKVMKVTIKKEKDFEKYKGKLEGKILFVSKPRKVKIDDAPIFRRHGDDNLSDIEEFPIPAERSEKWRKDGIKRWKLRKKTREFLSEEKALAIIEISSRDAGIIRLGGTGAYKVGENPGPTNLVMATEQYNRILRLVERDIEVELEIEVKARFHEDEITGYNTVAEIPGTTKKKEVVMLGAHLDSWHPGTGATDNASGSAVAMEAVRILKALGVKPKRTIRIALWSGEEQGLNGSRGYVKNHFATRPEPDDDEDPDLPRYYRKSTWPITTTSEHKNFSAYFNLDNGSGKIRGIYCQQNAAVRPIFEAWLEPFFDLGADTVSLRSTGSTDHVSFDAVGLPGFQFIQDPLEYRGRTHHTNLDVYDRLQRQDLMEAAVVMASFVYHAAMRDEKLPRKPMPQPEPEAEDEDEEDDDEDEE